MSFEAWAALLACPVAGQTRASCPPGGFPSVTQGGRRLIDTAIDNR